MSRTPAGLLNNAPLLLILVTLFWGGNAVAGKLAVGRVSPLLLTEFRWIITGAILLLLGRNYLKHDWPVVRENLGKLFLMGLTGFALFNFFCFPRSFTPRRSIPRSSRQPCQCSFSF